MSVFGKITAQNYAAQAVEALRQSAPALRGGDRIGVIMLAEQIEASVHFALPDFGRIFNDELRGLDGVDLRLPFPQVTLEYFVPLLREKLTGIHSFYSPKRVIYLEEISRDEYALVLEEEEAAKKRTRSAPIMPSMDGLDGDRFIYVSVALVVGGRWLAAGASFLMQCENWRREAPDGKGVAVAGKTGALLPDHFADMIRREGGEKAMLLMKSDIEDELRASLEFIEALSCSNIEQGVHLQAAKQSVNARRIAEGRRPINETRMLTINLGDRVQRGPRQTIIQDRQRPHEHLRRGHVRILPNGERKWIFPMVVNAGIGNRVDKQYRIHR